MKLITQLNPKHLFRSKKSSRSSVSRSDPFSSGSYSSSSSDGSSTNLKERIQLGLGSTTPTTVLPSRNQFLIHSSKSNDDEIISDFSSEIHLDLVQAFKLMDKDGDGKITRRELETLLKRVGADPLSEEVKIILTDVDHEQSGGCISLEKFGEISSAFGPACDSEIRDTFDFFDVDRDGKISPQELLGVFVSIGDNQCTLEDCQRMIAGVDSDGDGFVCFQDFTRMMEHQR